MATATTISLADSLAAAVDFLPRAITSAGDSHFENKTLNPDVFSLRPRISLSVSPASAQRNSTRVKYSVNVPNPDFTAEMALESQPTVFRANGTIYIPADFDLRSREDVYAILSSYMAHAVLESAIVDGEPVW